MTEKKTSPAKKTKAGGTVAPAEKRPAHRPSSFRPEFSEQAYKLCLLGATDKKLADFFGVSEQTLNAWKHAHPVFLESLTRGKEVADAEIAHSLFLRAKGYSHPDVHVANYQGTPIITDLVKHYPPDTPAAILWLKNRQPEVWREKVEVEHAGKNGGPIQTESKVELSPSDAYMAMLGKGNG